MSGGKGVGEVVGYERDVQSYCEPSVSQRSFFWRTWVVLRGLWVECGLSGVNTSFLEDWG